MPLALNSEFSPMAFVARHTFQKRVQMRPQPRLTKKDLRREYLTSAGGPLTKSAAEVGPISKGSEGNDRDGNDELGIKHPITESMDVSSISESVKSLEHKTSSKLSYVDMDENDILNLARSIKQ